jgi:hypothetical protein
MPALVTARILLVASPALIKALRSAMAIAPESPCREFSAEIACDPQPAVGHVSGGLCLLQLAAYSVR